MEIIYLIIILLPGLYIYSRLRKEGYEHSESEPEYVIIVRGLFYSMPLIAVILLFISMRYPNGDIYSTATSMIYNWKYILLYFAAIFLYAKLVIVCLQKYRKRIFGWLSKKSTKFTKKKAYRSGYISAWEEIHDYYMYQYSTLVGRLRKDGIVISFGQIDFISPHTIKDISFKYQQQYAAYFPKNKPSILKEIVVYSDLQTGYTLELYDGKTQVIKEKKN